MKIWISILIPVRNEADYIINCLESLCKQIPNSSTDIEVLIMDDDSQDNTLSLVQYFADYKPYIHTSFLDKSERPDLIGKARVLHFMAQKAKGEWLLTLDADVSLPDTWLASWRKHLRTNETDIVIGFTTVKGKSFWAKMQSLEWTFALCINWLLSLLKIPVTGLGNHMAMRKSAYEAVGGFEKVVSITEDYLIFHKMVQNGSTFKHLLHFEIAAGTKPEKSLRSFAFQRKRWMSELSIASLWIKILLLFYGLFAVVLLTSAYYSMSIFLSFLIFRWLTELPIFIIALWRLKMYKQIAWYPLYFLYSLLVHAFMLFLYFWKIPVIWKDKKY